MVDLLLDHAWPNYIVANRTDANWKEFGSEAGREIAQNQWDEFLFYRDPKELALTPKAVEEKAKDSAEWAFIHGDLRLQGHNVWDLYPDHSVSKKERALWVQAFIKAYSKTMDANVDHLIPVKLRKNLDLFCDLLSWLRFNMDGGDAKASDYGLRLSGRKKEKPEEPKPKPRPSWTQMKSAVTVTAKERVDKAWRRFIRRGHNGQEFRTNMLRFGFHPDEYWNVSDQEVEELFDVYRDVFEHRLGQKALELAPASAWKNSYLICALYDQQLTQEAGKRKRKPDGDKEGFWGLRQRVTWEEKEAQRKWRETETERIEKEFEKTQKKAKKTKVAGATMGAATVGDQALVITNISNLDGFSAAAGEEAGWEISQNLVEAIKHNPGPVIVVDSFAPLEGGPESSPRAWLVARLLEYGDAISWIQYDDGSADPYGDMLESLVQTLTNLNVGRVAIGGVWYGADEEGLCVDPVIETVGLYYPVEVEESIVACWA